MSSASTPSASTSRKLSWRAPTSRRVGARRDGPKKSLPPRTNLWPPRATTCRTATSAAHGSDSIDYGDDFGDFFAREYSSVVRLLVVVAGARAAEDIAQDAFLAAERRWDEVHAAPSPSAWVRRVALNKSASRFRRLHAEARAMARLDRRELAVSAPEAQEIWDVVRTLPRRQAQAVALRYLEDRSVAEIAEMVGCGEETVRTHLRRGKQRLAELLGEDEHDH